MFETNSLEYKLVMDQFAVPHLTLEQLAETYNNVNLNAFSNDAQISILEEAAKIAGVSPMTFLEEVERINQIRTYKTYNVFLENRCVRDTQAAFTSKLSDEELECLSDDNEDCWYDYTPTVYIGTVRAESETDACRKIVEQTKTRGYDYDIRTIYAEQVIV